MSEPAIDTPARCPKCSGLSESSELEYVRKCLVCGEIFCTICEEAGASAIPGFTCKQREQSQLRRENAALKAHSDRLEFERDFFPLTFWERLILVIANFAMAGLMLAGLIWTAGRVFR